MIDMDTSLSDLTTHMRVQQGKLIVRSTQDVEGYREQNRREYNDASSWRPMGSGRVDRPLRKFAEVPMIEIEQWLKEGINAFSNDPDMVKRVRRKLDDYTNRDLRTAPGRLGVRQKHI
jgi:hypothetical protein